MVDNFYGWQQDFNVLILECFESGINVNQVSMCRSIHFVHYAVILLTTKWTAYVSER